MPEMKAFAGYTASRLPMPPTQVFPAPRKSTDSSFTSCNSPLISDLGCYSLAILYRRLGLY